MRNCRLILGSSSVEMQPTKFFRKIVLTKSERKEMAFPNSNPQNIVENPIQHAIRMEPLHC